jgi:hypothetical protein
VSAADDPDDTERKTPGGTPPSSGSPWPDGVDADRYNAIVRQVRDYPGGARFTFLVQSIYGRHRVYETDSEGQRRPSAEYQRVDRAVADLEARGILRTEKRPRIRIQDGQAVTTRRRNDPVWVYPEWVPPFLKSSRQHPPRQSSDTANPETAVGSSHPAPDGSGAGTLPAQAPSGRAAQVARSVLRDRCSITPGPAGEGVRAALRHALAAHREGVDTAGMRADRVSAPGRVAHRQATYCSAWETAAARFHEGVVLTLTARPGESGDMIDSAVGVTESIGPLRDHLARQTPGPGRPPAIVVPEVTKRGVLHLHVAVFGVTPTAIDRDALSSYWYETREHGYIVDVAAIERRGPRWRWAGHGGDSAPGRYPRSYLGEMLHRVRAVAAADPDTIHGAPDRGWWAVALLWSCGLPLVSVSTGLRESRAARRARGSYGAGRSARRIETVRVPVPAASRRTRGHERRSAFVYVDRPPPGATAAADGAAAGRAAVGG